MANGLEALGPKTIRSSRHGVTAMKKSLFPALIALAATAITTYGQGFFFLDNYDSTAHPLAELNGSPITTGSGFTVGLYYVNTMGNYVSDFAPDISGAGLPTSLYSGPGTLTLGTGPGSTALVADPYVLDTPGQYASPNDFQPGFGAGATVTVMLMLYNGSSYSSASLRTHSTAFTIETSIGAAFENYTGDFETDGGMDIITPEPSVFALTAMSAAAFMLFRRKK